MLVLGLLARITGEFCTPDTRLRRATGDRQVASSAAAVEAVRARSSGVRQSVAEARQCDLDSTSRQMFCARRHIDLDAFSDTSSSRENSGSNQLGFEKIIAGRAQKHLQQAQFLLRNEMRSPAVPPAPPRRSNARSPNRLMFGAGIHPGGANGAPRGLQFRSKSKSFV